MKKLHEFWSSSQGRPGGCAEPWLRPPPDGSRGRRLPGARAEHFAAERHAEPRPGGAGGGATHPALCHGTVTWRRTARLLGGFMVSNMNIIYFPCHKERDN